jgi:hypothetical protein
MLKPSTGQKSSWEKCGAADCRSHPDLREARFWAANEALTEARIPSALPTIRE